MPLSPDSSNPLTGVMQSIMLRYHADMEAQVEHTLADLAGRWQGVRASLLTSITRLERQMQAAVKAGDTITYTWLAQQARLLDLKAAVAGDIAAYAKGARDIIGNAQGDAAELGLAAAQAKLDALTPPGVNYTWGVPPRDVLDQIAGATQPYTPLYALFEQMGAQAATNAAQALFQSVALGEGPREAARRLVWATDMSARRAEVIARTEIHRAWRQAQFANYQANSDVVSSWMWSADFASERTCGACIALDGSIHPLDEELADHVCGRCDAIPVTRPWSDILAGTGIPDDELAALDEGDASTWMDYRESGGEWLARQPADTQNRVLGPAKAEAWRQGAISLRDVASITHDPTWGRSIEERSLKSLGLDAQKWLAEARSNGTAATTMSEEARTALSEWEQQRAAAIAEVKAAEAEAAAGVAQPSEWEAQRAAAIAEAEGFGAPASATQALEGVGAPAETSPVWQQIADKLTTQEGASATAAESPEVLAAQQKLADIQTQIDQAAADWAARGGVGYRPDALESLSLDYARAQAELDQALGGKGIILETSAPDMTATDPLGLQAIDARFQQLFGRSLTRDEITGLVGASEPGAYLSVQLTDYGSFILRLHAPDWSHSFADTSLYDAARYLKLEGGKLVMHNESFYIDEMARGQGLGAEIFSNQVEALSALGVDRIETQAAGDALDADLSYNGYYTWPRFGYVGQLDQVAVDRLAAAVAAGDVPASWADYTTVQEIMATPEGRDWWKANGFSAQLAFDLAPDSLSMRLLDAYLREKGLR